MRTLDGAADALGDLREVLENHFLTRISTRGSRRGAHCEGIATSVRTFSSTHVLRQCPRRVMR